MNCSICKDKGYFVLRSKQYRRFPCGCGQKGGGLAAKTGESTERTEGGRKPFLDPHRS